MKQLNPFVTFFTLIMMVCSAFSSINYLWGYLILACVATKGVCHLAHMLFFFWVWWWIIVSGGDDITLRITSTIFFFVGSVVYIVWFIVGRSPEQS